MPEINTKSPSILVCGGGPAGSLSAILLARQGFSVTLLEHQKEFRQKVCGEYLCPAGVELLTSLDLAEQLQLHSYPKLFGMEVNTADQKKLSGDFSHDQKRYGVSLRREKFDQDLLTIARTTGESGVHVVQGMSVAHVRRQGDRWQLEGLLESETRLYEADFLVAADGRNSLVCRELDLTYELEEKKVALHAELPNPFPQRKVRGEMHLLGDGSYFGLNPVTEKLVNLSLVCPAEKIYELKGIHNVFCHYLLQSPELSSRWPDFERWHKELKVLAATPVSHFTRPHKMTNLALVGDAASFVDPLTGEGIFQALKSAELLGLTFQHQMDGVYYQKLRRKTFQSKTRLNLFFQQVIRSKGLIALLYFVLSRFRNGGNFLIALIGNTLSAPKQSELAPRV
jgi:2-polyprenyl-6-methoxyphenol hydroxylase-like FAD-dependent oxidoreductase